MANPRSSRWPKKPLSRVVFLDVDGVLNSAAEMSAGNPFNRGFILIMGVCFKTLPD